MRVAWSLLMARSWLTALLSLDLLISVSALKCLQCTSLKERDCESGHMSPTQCKENDRYCTKFTGDSGGFVYRSCSVEEQRQCEFKNIHGLKVHVCFHSCDTDGCNTAMTLTSFPASILLAIALSCLVLTAASVLF